MSYLGYTRVVSTFCEELAKSKGVITILEIGVDRGQTTLPLLHNLVTNGVEFISMGVDIRQDWNFSNQLDHMDGVRPNFPHVENPNYYYFIKNSLDWLPEFVENNPTFKFDVILLDGDHNYQTVSKELEYFDQLSFPHTLCVLDDYHGKYAEKDDYYADKPSHDGLDHKEFDRNLEKKGMKTAVNEFVEANDNWKLTDLGVPGWEPVLMSRDLEIGGDPRGIVHFTLSAVDINAEE